MANVTAEQYTRSAAPSVSTRVVVAAVILIPLLALIAAVPVAWNRWISWLDVLLALVLYLFTAVGITVGYHRYFTHGSFKAKPWVAAVLGVAGSLALEGSISSWVAGHRKHHANSDEADDPHSPWKYGTGPWAVAKGFMWAHVGWLVAQEPIDARRWAPDMLNRPLTARLSSAFGWLALATFVTPAILGGLITWSWQGALTAFFWAGLVRIALVHHVTWSINSVCHIWGKQPFVSRDQSRNVAWLALPSLGESWHNFHHAEPTAARHGVLPRQVDPSAAMIRFAEHRGWVFDVKWPKPERIAAKRSQPARMGP
jgi:stearoyl-CoA desaturase (Delta-9 desaturase)